MRKKYLRLALAACALLYAVSIGSAALRITLRQADHQREADQEFVELVEKATAAASLGFMDEPFRDAVRQSLEKSNSIAAVIVTGPSGPEYAVEREDGYLKNEEGIPAFVSRFNIASAPMVAPLRIEAARNATINAARLLLHPAELLVILRDALLLALVPLLATLLILLFSIRESGRDDESVESAADEHPASPIIPEGDAIEEEFDIPEIAPDVSADLPEEDPLEPLEEELSDISETVVPLSTLEESPPATTAPTGLYGPEGVLGWEEYLGERLEAELKRAAAFEQDLVLLLAVIDITNEDAFVAFAREVVGFFSFKDLAFKFGKNGAAVILPNTDIDRGIRYAEEFMAKYRKGGTNLEIGISARTGRLVDGSRLLMEAHAALDRSRQEGNFQIMGFKPDPERYRSFVTSQC